MPAKCLNSLVTLNISGLAPLTFIQFTFTPKLLRIPLALLRNKTTMYPASRIALLIFFGLLVSQASIAQDDTWWQRLFKKETVESQKEAPDKKETEEQEPEIKEVPRDSVKTEPENEAINVSPSFGRGEIHFSEPAMLAYLDSVYRDDPPPVKGYRIQIYFGTLSEAREIRSNAILAHPEISFYLQQNPPNFVVLCGDFRNSLEAYRALEWCQEEHPGAMVVQSTIDASKVTSAASASKD